MRTAKALIAATLTVAWLAPKAGAHCQIPCGIYDDAARLTQLAEHVTTMEKAIKQIQELSAATGQVNYNQIVRWVGAKESHADQFAVIVTDYFLTQRIKPVDKEDAHAYAKYVAETTLLHQMLVGAMKVKQGTDLANINALRELLAAFESSYMGMHAGHGGEHAQPHH